MTKIELFGLNKIPLVKKGDNISALIMDALKAENLWLKDHDVLLIAETIVSKSEGNFIKLDEIDPSQKSIEISKKSKKDPNLVEAIKNRSNEIITTGPGFIICETKHGFVCANAGIDESNVEDGLVTPIPEDPDRSAAKIRVALEKITAKELAIIITDTHGRAFRNGAVGVAIGCSGISPLWKRAGEEDLYGRELQTTEIAVADELASAASLLMGQANEGIPVVILRGLPSFNILKKQKDGISKLIRPKKFDVFRK